MEWHDVSINRKENDLTLVIDGIHRKEHTLSDRYLELNINYGVYIGGIGNFTQVYLGNYNNYRGCLEKLIFNDVDVLERARETRAVIKDVTFDCSSEFNAYSSEPISFLGDGSYLTFTYDTATTRHGGSLTFDLKTGASMGILFYITSKNPMIQDFFGVELVNGQLQLSANDGNGMIVLQSDVTVNNGYWHRVEIDFSPSRYVLTVNEKSRETRPSLGENRYFDFNTDLYVGGIETSKLRLASKQGMRSLFADELDVSFKGCLQYVKLNGQLLGLQEVSVSKQIKNGCVWEYVCLVSEPCVESAECVQDDYDSFRCFCDAEQCVKENYSSNNQRTPRQQLFVFSDDPLGIQLLTISPLVVLEGTNELITEKHIEIAPELNKYNIDENSVIYIVSNPSHGVIEIDRFEASRNMPDTAFRYSQLIHRGIRYIHDGSDSGNDSIVLKIEFFSRSLRLPDYLEGRRKTFTFPISVISRKGPRPAHEDNSDRNEHQERAPKVSHENNGFRLERAESSKDSMGSKDEKESDAEFRYLNLAVTGSHLLLVVVCVFTSLGLCTLLIMVKILAINSKQETKNQKFDADVVDKTRHLHNRNNSSSGPGSDIMSGHGSEIMVDDSGRGSIGYDRSSTMISEITPFYPGLTNNDPSSCTNLSIRSNTATPISSFGKGLRECDLEESF